MVITALSVDEEMGAQLVEAGLVQAADVERALGVCQRSDLPIGAALVSLGALRRDTLYRFYAERWGCPFVDLLAADPDPRLLHRLAPGDALHQHWIPVRRESDGTVVVATCQEPTPERREMMAATMGEPVRVEVTTFVDIADAVRRGYREHVLDEACYGLWRRAADQSARQTFVRPQLIAFAAVVVVIVAGLVFATGVTLTVLAVAGSLIFLASVLFKFLVCLRGARHEHDIGITDDDVAALTDEQLPTYTVLVPVYREANVVADLVQHLGALDYPPEKLEVLILLEEDDLETIAAARAAKPPAWFTLLVVPNGLPKTKPKACNVGLFFAHGEYLVIYDAEDRPDPDQLKKAIIAFRRSGPERACVQAALNYWNVEENVLTRMFTLEYSFWFDYMLPGLDSSKLPIPLGGTSNHFRVDVLRQLGGWDPFNVTEDADLGIRASALGYSVGRDQLDDVRGGQPLGAQLDPPALPVDQGLPADRARPPAQPAGAGAHRRMAAGDRLRPADRRHAVHLPAGPAAVADLLHVAVLPDRAGRDPAGVGRVAQPGQPAARQRRDDLPVDDGRVQAPALPARAVGLLNPVYWVLHSIASYKALWQLLTKPHYWEKTAHGISTVTAARSSGEAAMVH